MGGSASAQGPDAPSALHHTSFMGRQPLLLWQLWSLGVVFFSACCSLLAGKTVQPCGSLNLKWMFLRGSLISPSESLLHCPLKGDAHCHTRDTTGTGQMLEPHLFKNCKYPVGMEPPLPFLACWQSDGFLYVSFSCTGTRVSGKLVAEARVVSGGRLHFPKMPSDGSCLQRLQQP